MKKFTCSVIAVLLVLALAASAFAAGVSTPPIVATSYPMYAVAREITDGYMDISYEPAEGEGTVTIGDYVITASDCAAEAIEGDSDTLTVPVNVMVYACILGEILADIDPDNNEVYQERIGAMIEEFSDIDQLIQSSVTADTAVSCDDGSMGYFAQEYGVKLTNDGTVLHTFNAFAAEEEFVPYCELMLRNVEALAG